MLCWTWKMKSVQECLIFSIQSCPWRSTVVLQIALIVSLETIFLPVSSEKLICNQVNSDQQCFYQSMQQIIERNNCLKHYWLQARRLLWSYLLKCSVYHQWFCLLIVLLKMHNLHYLPNWTLWIDLLIHDGANFPFDLFIQRDTITVPVKVPDLLACLSDFEWSKIIKWKCIISFILIIGPNSIFKNISLWYSCENHFYPAVSILIF